jgi:hypothetical protein
MRRVWVYRASEGNGQAGVVLALPHRLELVLLLNI